MVINIDISIADSDGTVLHHFSNRFDENDAYTQKQEPRPVQGLEFDDFLAEYMSCSGFIIREKLIYGSYPADIGHCSSTNKDLLNKRDALYQEDILDRRDMLQQEDIPDKRDALYQYEDSELEYKIRIGDHKVLTGKIPLRLPLLSEEKAPRSKVEAKQPYRTPQDEPDEIEGFLNYTMIRAIEKYEANLYPSWVEPEDREAEFVLEE